MKPADNVLHLFSQPDRSATPAIYADERNLCLKRRENREVKVAETLRPKGQGGWPHLLSFEVRDYPRWLFERETTNARRIGGSYGLLEHVRAELRNSDTA